MKKKRFIAVSLLFIFLACLEMGIFTEVLWHGWGGFGDISLEYTEAGNVGITFLVFFMPVSVIVIFLIRIVLCIKKIRNIKELFLDGICALSGIGITVGIALIAPVLCYGNPIFRLGRLIASFPIDVFHWMTVPIP